MGSPSAARASRYMLATIARTVPTEGQSRLSKGSHPGQERWTAFAIEASFHGLYHPGEYIPLLPPTGFHHRQQPLDKPAPLCGLRAERQLPPNYRLTQRPLRSIVRRLHSFYFHKGPQILTMLPQTLAKAPHTRVEVAAQQ